MSDYSLFSVLGIEIEYMLVDSQHLNVQPQSDLLLKELAGELVNEVALGDIAISNELVLHVLELKNNGPKPPDASIAAQFQKAIEKLQPYLAARNLQLLPTGAHPWMNPLQETKRWPHGNRDIYHQFDTIFNCQGHGWSNLQSMHVNLPFANDEEFNHLHNAIRLVLPLLPALAASTPFLEGKKTGLNDSRLYFYGKNQQRIPSISGDIIPEFISSEDQYKKEILEPMYRAIHPHDPQGILQYEWLNSRAAIPKFEYKAIEIRILDSQECVQADIAIALTIHAILKYWSMKSSYYLDNPCETKRLKTVYEETVNAGFQVQIEDAELARQWLLPKRSMSVRSIWSHLIEKISHELDYTTQKTLEFILNHGNLSERLLNACGNEINHATLTRTYRQLSHCLLANQLFNPT
ncbi:carboxylate-amine ligase [Legionella jamestowniensis]|uniref:Glutamate--cysteine ligase n=1 Tax=Legionella jamestowniensis TaxID=455 RepID=A0A0W0UJS0_9GAMM|nr:glutamate-cysteine ligase family protein [Legionella jamestowniensis]KTD08031.1 Glutamate--cysteine ligase, GCS2 [Legionella jamestowniensis]OCH97316.1 glutamate--cysteine ligase [Legionella jamestowniensis]SFM06334.1 Glutamate-cysteine ligase family 2(GCS2) [Legionella jamestowniensis DSM 19215]